MALQLLPILLLGGGAAYVVSKQKEKERKRSGALCPPVVTLTVGELATVAAQAEEKFKDVRSPFGEVNYFLAQLLPEDCNKSSKNSRIKIQIPAGDFDISIPDFYAMAVSNSVETRVGRGLITHEQGMAAQAKALEWYKKATGKVFDPSSLGLERLVKAFEEAVVDPNGRKPADSEKCPSKYEYAVTPDEQQMVRDFVDAELARENKSAFKIGDLLLERITPPGCTKTDFKTVVAVTIDFPGEPSRNMGTINMASFYALMVSQIAKVLLSKNVIGPPQLQAIESRLRSDYKKLTGGDLADPFN